MQRQAFPSCSSTITSAFLNYWFIFCLTILPLKLILNIETEPIFLTRLQGREVTKNAEAFLVKNHYFLRLLIMFSICVQYSAFKNRFTFTTQNFKLRNTDLAPEEKQ